MDKKLLEDLVKQGLSQYKIAKKLDTCQSNVRYWLYRHKLRTNRTDSNTLLTNPRRIHKVFCLSCNKELGRQRRSDTNYCNQTCQQKYQYDARIVRWKAGEELGYFGETKQLASWIRKYLLDKYDNTCVKCRWNKRHPIDNLPLVEVNHIDGNAENCKEENLEVICPNCHSETHNFRARNKESSRNRKSMPN